MSSARQNPYWKAFDHLRGWGQDPVTSAQVITGLVYMQHAAEGRFDTQKWRGEVSPQNALGKIEELLSAPELEEQMGPLRAMGLVHYLDLGAHSPRHESVDGRALDTAISLTAPLESSQETAQALDDFLAMAYVQGSYGNALLHTPPPLVDLMVELLDTTAGDRVYDPVCGTGAILAAAHESADGAVSLFGQDLDKVAVAIARMRLAVQDKADVHLSVGESLFAPAYTDGHALQTFDRVVAHPPWGVRVPKHEVQSDVLAVRFPYGPVGRFADAAFIQHCTAALNERGKAVIAVSPAVLSRSGSDQRVRSALVKQDLVEAVVALPQGTLPHTGVPPVLLVLNRKKASELQGRVLVVDLRAAELTREAHDSIVELYRSPRAERRVSAILSNEEVIETDGALVPSLYIDFVDLDSFMGGQARRVKLEDVADVYQGSRVDRDGEAAGPVVQGRDLSGTSIDPDDLEHKGLDERSEPVTCEAGDILIQRIGQRPAVAVVTPNLEGLPLTDTVYVVRLRERDLDLSAYLAELFQSHVGHDLLLPALGGAVVPTLSKTKLRRVEVPLPQRGVVDLIEDVRSVEADLLQRIQEAKRLRSRLFTSDDPESFDDRLRSLKTEAEVLKGGLVQVDDPAYRIRNFYPFPLAYSYRTLDGSGDLRDRHDGLLSVAESTLAFLASIGLSIAVHVGALEDPDDELLHPTQIRGKYWASGTSLGDWKDLGHRVAKLLRSNDSGEDLPRVAEDYAAVWFEKKRGKRVSAFFKMAEDLVTRRNDAKHDRGPSTEREYESACEELQRLVDGLYSHLAWLISYPMRMVVRVRQSWREQSFEADTVLYSGDHPVLRQETIKVPGPLPEAHLYLQASADEWISLYPLTSVHTCRRCERPETYFVDRWEGAGKRTRLKSYERGHTLSFGTEDPDSEAAEMLSQDLHTWLTSS